MSSKEVIKNRIKEEVLGSIDMTGGIEDDTVLEIIDSRILGNPEIESLSLREKVEMRKEIFNSIRKLDILSELLEDDSITEVMINGTKSIFIEKEGRLIKLDKRFEDKEKLLSVAQQIASGANRVVNGSNPIVDAILPDGSRASIVLEGVSCNGTAITVRKFPNEILDMEKLIGLNAVDRETAEFLKMIVRAGYNIFISGGTGTGKTTFLNALSEYIPKDERVITIEDSAELRLNGIENLVRLEGKNANVEGMNAITIRDLIKTSLRMRPDRIIVGEVRDAAAMDMISAMNTGHDGSLSTGHANSVPDMLLRLESMLLMAVDIPVIAIRQQIASAIDIFIHLGRLRDRSRKVLEISEVIGVKDGEIKLNPLYAYVETGERKGQVEGYLEKRGELMNISKLISAGFLK